MRVLVACEFSGIVRDAFVARGHDAWSCDLLPTERPGQHIQGDALPLLKRSWDLLIAHPPCTRICNSGVCWLAKRNLWDEMQAACRFFRAFIDSGIPGATENPIPHKYALAEIGRKYDQIIHPWEHGHGESKATCLWLTGVPPLMATNIVAGRVQRLHREPPGPDRWRIRSRTYEGIARAMAEQWG